MMITIKGITKCTKGNYHHAFLKLDGVEVPLLHLRICIKVISIALSVTRAFKKRVKVENRVRKK